MGREEEEAEKHHVKQIFTYGTLKKGFPNHVLLEDMISSGDASYLGVYTTVNRMPLVCGPYRVPFLLNIPGSGKRVTGEVYSVSAAALARIDELEGTLKAHYERLPISVLNAHDNDVTKTNGALDTAPVEAYFAHKSYGGELWKRNAETGFQEYTDKEAKGYVKRSERQPSHFTFLDHIRLFLSPSD